MLESSTKPAKIRKAKDIKNVLHYLISEQGINQMLSLVQASAVFTAWKTACNRLCFEIVSRSVKLTNHRPDSVKCTDFGQLSFLIFHWMLPKAASRIDILLSFCPNNVGIRDVRWIYRQCGFCFDSRGTLYQFTMEKWAKATENEPHCSNFSQIKGRAIEKSGSLLKILSPEIRYSPSSTISARN